MGTDIIDLLGDSGTGTTTGPHVIEASSTAIMEAIRTAGARFGRDNLRYYLSAGTGPSVRPLWGIDAGHAPESARSVLSMVESILHCSEEREAAIERELAGLAGWLADRADRPSMVIVETFGPLAADQVAFLRACSERVGGRPGSRLVVLRHARPAETAGSIGTDRQTEEILLALSLAGGSAPAEAVQGWGGRRGWQPAAIAAVTTTRDTGNGRLISYRDPDVERTARLVRARADAESIGELATLVAAGAGIPLISSAQLATDPAVLLDAFSRPACALAADRPATLLEACRALLRLGAASGWTAVDRSTCWALCLAAVVRSGRGRLSAASADRVLRLAEHARVTAAVRSLLGYDLGQVLAKTKDLARWRASVRFFSYARQYASPTPADGASRVAASYNGEALARYRSGDLAGAIGAEQAGLAALTAAGVPDSVELTEQRVLLLTNLADVYGRNPATVEQAIDCGRQAYRLAIRADSLTALNYAVPGLVRRLLAAGDRHEAEQVAGALLDRYDREQAPRRAAEQTVVSVCSRLAAARLADDPADAAAWYAEAARRMRRARQQAVDAVLASLRALSATNDAIALDRLEAELADQRSVRQQLLPLAGLLDQRSGQ